VHVVKIRDVGGTELYFRDPCARCGCSAEACGRVRNCRPPYSQL